MNRQNPAKERRRSPRKSFSELPLVFSLTLKEPLSGALPLRLDAKNISLHGIKFQSNHKFPLFSEVQLQLLNRTGSEPPLRLRAKIVRVEEVDLGLAEKNHGIAAEFLDDPSSILSQYFGAVKQGL